MSQLEVAWLDRFEGPSYPPDPAYPQGRDLDLSTEGLCHCRTALPYPAKRCGYYIVRCHGLRADRSGHDRRAAR